MWSSDEQAWNMFKIDNLRRILQLYEEEGPCRALYKVQVLEWNYHKRIQIKHTGNNCLTCQMIKIILFSIKVK